MSPWVFSWNDLVQLKSQVQGSHYWNRVFSCLWTLAKLNEAPSWWTYVLTCCFELSRCCVAQKAVSSELLGQDSPYNIIIRHLHENTFFFKNCRFMNLSQKWKNWVFLDDSSQKSFAYFVAASNSTGKTLHSKTIGTKMNKRLVLFPNKHERLLRSCFLSLQPSQLIPKSRLPIHEK